VWSSVTLQGACWRVRYQPRHHLLAGAKFVSSYSLLQQHIRTRFTLEFASVGVFIITSLMVWLKAGEEAARWVTRRCKVAAALGAITTRKIRVRRASRWSWVNEWRGINSLKLRKWQTYLYISTKVDQSKEREWRVKAIQRESVVRGSTPHSCRPSYYGCWNPKLGPQRQCALHLNQPEYKWNLQWTRQLPPRAKEKTISNYLNHTALHISFYGRPYWTKIKLWIMLSYLWLKTSITVNPQLTTRRQHTSQIWYIWYPNLDFASQNRFSLLSLDVICLAKSSEGFGVRFSLR
jgi:hypothetical protein